MLASFDQNVPRNALGGGMNVKNAGRGALRGSV
jgi:hypothetical protein